MTTRSLTTLKTLLQSIVSADSYELDSTDQENVVKSALERYSRDRPDTQTDDVTGAGGKYYGIASSVDNWVEDFSEVQQVEYPAAAVASDEIPQLLDAADWQDDYWVDVSGTQTRYLFFPNHSPGSTETIRITYTKPYTFDVSSNVDLPDQHLYAIGWLMACLYCQEVAAKYARLGDSTIGADSTAHVDKSRNFAARAKEFCQMYQEALGIGAGITGTEDAGSLKAAGAFVDMDTAPGWPPGRQFLFHGKQTR